MAESTWVQYKDEGREADSVGVLPGIKLERQVAPQEQRGISEQEQQHRTPKPQQASWAEQAAAQ